MLIACPNCATTYQVKPASLGSTGRSVRCTRCRNVWFAANTAALAEIADAHRSDIAALSATLASAEPGEAPPLPTEPHSGDLSPDDFGSSTQPHGAGDPDSPPIAPELAQEPPSYGNPPEVTDAPAIAPGAAADPIEGRVEETVGEDIETVAARRARKAALRRRGRWPLPPTPTMILGLVTVCVALLGFRTDVVRLLPQTASFYAAIHLPVNLRGLVFKDVVTSRDSLDGVQVLVVEGSIVSVTNRVTEVPRLRFAVRNQAGREIYSWTALPARNALAPGETITFRSRLASPPPESQEVLVRFFNRRDLVAGNP